jgi:hypothetical protein
MRTTTTAMLLYMEALVAGVSHVPRKGEFPVPRQLADCFHDLTKLHVEVSHFDVLVLDRLVLILTDLLLDLKLDPSVRRRGVHHRKHPAVRVQPTAASWSLLRGSSSNSGHDLQRRLFGDFGLAILRKKASCVILSKPHRLSPKIRGKLNMSDSDSESETEFEDQEFTLGGHSLVVSTIVELGLEQLSRLEQNKDEISGQRAWPGSLLLCSFIIDQQWTVMGKRVLELGCGCGLTSMLAAKLSALRVLATDGDERCLRRLRQNINRNFQDGDPTCRAAALLWGDDASSPKPASSSSHAYS